MSTTITQQFKHIQTNYQFLSTPCIPQSLIIIKNIQHLHKLFKSNAIFLFYQTKQLKPEQIIYFAKYHLQLQAKICQNARQILEIIKQTQIINKEIFIVTFKKYEIQQLKYRIKYFTNNNQQIRAKFLSIQQIINMNLLDNCPNGGQLQAALDPTKIDYYKILKTLKIKYLINKNIINFSTLSNQNLQKYHNSFQTIINHKLNQQLIMHKFIQFAQQLYKQENQKIKQIQQFKQKYTKVYLLDSKIIQLYTQDSFLHKIINIILRSTHDITQLFYIQPFVCHLYRQIKRLYMKKQEKKQFTCYRGCYFSVEQIQMFMNNIGQNIKCLGFLSTSLNSVRIYKFVGNASLIIHVNQYQINQKDKILQPGYALISQYSFYKSEQQVLFNPFNTFKIMDVKVNQNQIQISLKLICESLGQQRNNLQIRTLQDYFFKVQAIQQNNKQKFVLAHKYLQKKLEILKHQIVQADKLNIVYTKIDKFLKIIQMKVQLQIGTQQIVKEIQKYIGQILQEIIQNNNNISQKICNKLVNIKKSILQNLLTQQVKIDKKQNRLYKKLQKILKQTFSQYNLVEADKKAISKIQYFFKQNNKIKQVKQIQNFLSEDCLQIEFLDTNPCQQFQYYHTFNQPQSLLMLTNFIDIQDRIYIQKSFSIVIMIDKQINLNTFQYYHNKYIKFPSARHMTIQQIQKIIQKQPNKITQILCDEIDQFICLIKSNQIMRNNKIKYIYCYFTNSLGLLERQMVKQEEKDPLRITIQSQTQLQVLSVKYKKKQILITSQINKIFQAHNCKKQSKLPSNFIHRYQQPEIQQLYKQKHFIYRMTLNSIIQQKLDEYIPIQNFNKIVQLYHCDQISYVQQWKDNKLGIDKKQVLDMLIKKQSKIFTMLRYQNPQILFYLQIIIKMLYEQINSLWINKIFKLQKGLTVYKADYISKQQLQKFNKGINNYIYMKQFILCSRIQRYAEQYKKEYNIIFQIYIPPLIQQNKQQIGFTLLDDIDRYPSQKQVLFKPMSKFIVKSIKQTYIQLQYVYTQIFTKQIQKYDEKIFVQPYFFGSKQQLILEQVLQRQKAGRITNQGQIYTNIIPIQDNHRQINSILKQGIKYWNYRYKLYQHQYTSRNKKQQKYKIIKIITQIIYSATKLIQLLIKTDQPMHRIVKIFTHLSKLIKLQQKIDILQYKQLIKRYTNLIILLLKSIKINIVHQNYKQLQKIQQLQIKIYNIIHNFTNKLKYKLIVLRLQNKYKMDINNNNKNNNDKLQMQTIRCFRNIALQANNKQLLTQFQLTNNKLDRGMFYNYQNKNQKLQWIQYYGTLDQFIIHQKINKSSHLNQQTLNIMYLKLINLLLNYLQYLYKSNNRIKYQENLIQQQLFSQISQIQQKKQKSINSQQEIQILQLFKKQNQQLKNTQYTQQEDDNQNMQYIEIQGNYQDIQQQSNIQAQEANQNCVNIKRIYRSLLIFETFLRYKLKQNYGYACQLQFQKQIKMSNKDKMGKYLNKQIKDNLKILLTLIQKKFHKQLINLTKILDQQPLNIYLKISNGYNQQNLTKDYNFTYQNNQFIQRLNSELYKNDKIKNIQNELLSRNKCKDILKYQQKTYDSQKYHKLITWYIMNIQQIYKTKLRQKIKQQKLFNTYKRSQIIKQDITINNIINQNQRKGLIQYTLYYLTKKLEYQMDNIQFSLNNIKGKFMAQYIKQFQLKVSNIILYIVISRQVLRKEQTNIT